MQSSSSSINENFPIKENFQAEWPDFLNPELKSLCSKVLKVFWDIISIIIFPIGLFRLAAHCLKQYLFSYLVVPGTGSLFSEAIKEYGKYWCESLGGQTLTLKTPDGAELNAAFFPGKNREKAIIYAFGNGECWESCRSKIELLKRTGVSIIMVNPRNSASDSSQLGLDVYTVYEYLEKIEKIKLINVLLIGFSMGAAYGNLGAAIKQQEHPEVPMKALIVNSFDLLSNEVYHLVGGGCRGSMLTLGMKALNLEIDSKSAFQSLKGEKCIVYSNTDKVIPKAANLYQAIKQDNRDDITKIRLRNDPDGVPFIYSHNRPLHLDEMDAFLKQIQNMLDIESIEEIDVEPVVQECMHSLEEMKHKKSDLSDLLNLKCILKQLPDYVISPPLCPKSFSHKKIKKIG